ncbi:hypothetical protein L4C36_21375 [Photobacterium japonica]|uniref:DUF7305 domain-containing protein n=1 Tax=Photobacterium japonica TaxID=2910235 RepID=UPI003D12D2D9
MQTLRLKHYSAKQNASQKQKKERGFALISVLILSMMAGGLVLNSLKDNVTQERLSGNFQKKTNARLVAEKGVFDTYDYLNEQLALHPDKTLDVLLAGMETTGSAPGITDMTYALTIDAAAGTNKLVLQSDGLRFDGKTVLKANFELESSTSTSSSAFGRGIVGCDRVALSGSGKINSYNSALGDYGALKPDGEPNIAGNVTVRTLNANDLVELSGTGKIDGNVIAVGNVEFGGSAHITGNLSSNGTINMFNNSTIGGDVFSYQHFNQRNGAVAGSIHANNYVKIEQTKVGGNIISAGYVTATGESIGGDILSNGDITLRQVTTWGVAQTYSNYSQYEGSVNGVKSKQNVSLLTTNAVIHHDNLAYAGVGSFAKEWSGAPDSDYLNPPYKVDPPEPEIALVPMVDMIPIDDGVVDINDPNDMTCDPLDIENQLLTVESFADHAKDLDVNDTGGDTTLYTLSNTLGEFTHWPGSASTKPSPIAARNAPFISVTQPILMYDNANINGKLAVKAGHNVFMFVKGNFIMSGASTLTIPDNSSLTLLVKGDLIIGAGSEVLTPTHGLTADGLPVFSIFSSYSGTGVYITGGVEQVYAAIYAPLTDIAISSSVGFKGALLGKSVSVTGAGGIHYDEAIGDAEVGKVTTTSPPNLVFKGWQSL